MKQIMNDFNLPTATDKPTKTSFTLWAYVDNKKKKVGYAYTTKGGNLCIRADKMLDKAQLGRLLVNGLYVQSPHD